MKDERTIVHLVHGTWPFGPFRRERRPGDAPAWFEEGSEFRTAVARFAVDPIEFDVLRWTGRNHVRDRYEAGLKLRAQILARAEKEPGTKQIVIAHSHGGNAALAALELGAFLHSPPPVVALICVATPFISLTTSERRVRSIFPACASALSWAAMVLTLAIAHVPVAVFVAGSAIVPLLFAPMLKRLHADYSPPERSRYLFKTLPVSPRAFILRSTRDEAALAIGLAQAMQVTHTRMLRFLGSKPSKAGLVGFLILALASWGCLLLIAPGLQLVIAEAGLLRAVVIIAALGPVPFSALYLLAYVALAFAAGFQDPRMWGSNQHIEVEPVPYEQTCEFKSYLDAGTVFADTAFALPMLPGERPTPPGLRHAIYTMSAVQRDIGLLISDVQLGNSPTLLAGERILRMEARQKRRERQVREGGSPFLRN